MYKKGSYDLQVTRTYIKLHLKQPKLFIDFDLLGDIDINSPLNKIAPFDNRIEIIAGKLAQEDWTSLTQLNKQTANERRAISQ